MVASQAMAQDVKPLADGDEAYSTTVWSRGDYNSSYYRIPALETAADGSVIAVTDARHNSIGDLPNYISVYARRSEDQGRTWSDNMVIHQGVRQSDNKGGYGDPSIVRNVKNDKIHIFYNGNNGYFASTYSDPITLWMATSDDNGKTWGEPVNITRRIYQTDWNGAFITSGRGYCTDEGRIYLALNVRKMGKNGSYSWACWTDDDGETWHVADNSSTPLGNGNESKIIGLKDGTLLMSIRAPGQHMMSKSTDNGVTWGEPYAVAELVEPGCNGDIIRYPSTDGRDRLLLSIPNNGSRRTNNTVFVSYDEGQTWPVKKTIHGEASAYSSMAIFPDGSIGYLVEAVESGSDSNGYDIMYYHFPLSYVEGGTGGSGDGVLSPGYLDCDGTRYMAIPNTNGIFDVDTDQQMSLFFRCHISEWGNGLGMVCHRVHPSTSNSSLLDGFEFYHYDGPSRAASLNVNQNTGSSQQNLNGKVFYDLNAVGMSGYDTDDYDQYIDFAWVYDPANNRSDAYVNGVKVESIRNELASAAMYKLTNPNDVLLGARYMGSNDAISNMLEGRIDDVRFYSRALTDEEVAAQPGLTVGKDTPDLIAAYDFEKISGATVPDISGNGNDGQLVGFPDYVADSDKFTVTFTLPDAGMGTLHVYNGDVALYSGSLVADGTEIRIVATPNTGFVTDKIYVDGEAIDGDTYVVHGNCNVSVGFVRDPNAEVEYTIPAGTMHTNGQTYVESVASEGASHDIDVTFDRCPSSFYTLIDQTIEAAPGNEFTLKLNAHKLGGSSTLTVYQDLRYTCAYIYTDWYGFGTWKSHGVLGSIPPSQNVLGNYDYVMEIAEGMTPPADVTVGTKARIRVIYHNAWSAISSANATNVSEGQALDIPVTIVEASAIDNIAADEAEGPVEYFNLQGMRVAPENLVPGIYVRRQGSVTTKVHVK